MKKRLACLLLILAVCLPSLAALADVSATPNQRLFFRTGPNTKFVGIGHMPETTALTAIEYESGNGVTWVLVEYERDGKLERAYTGLKRMTVNGDIPWADHLDIEATVTSACSVYGGPGTWYMLRSGLRYGDTVTLLRFDDGFAYVEFDDADAGEPSRGWIDSACLDDGWWYEPPYEDTLEDRYGVSFSSGTLVCVTRRAGALMYEEPSSDAVRLRVVPYGTVLDSFSTTGNGYLYVNYDGWEGFIKKSELALY